MVFRAENGADGLVKRLREVFVTFGVPEELTSDGGPQFTAGKTQEFLRSWGVRHRLTSVANPHANSRAEIAVKTVKRMLMDNTAPNGSIDIDRFQKAMIIYRNSIDPETKASPALIIFGRPIRDPIPIPMGRYCPHATWRETLAYREQALAKRHSREHEKWDQHTRSLPQLHVGDHVYIQNLTGNHPKRWERTGVVVEVRQYHQYVVKIDGSGRLTLRNRQHLRKFTPFNKPNREQVIEALLPSPKEIITHPVNSSAPAIAPPPPSSPREGSPTALHHPAAVTPRAEESDYDTAPEPSSPSDSDSDTSPEPRLPHSSKAPEPRNPPQKQPRALA